MWLEDCVAVLVTAGVGTYGSNILVSTKAALLLPAPDAALLTIVETSGSGATRTQNKTSAPAYTHPSAQVTTRATTYPVARAMAQAAYDALSAVTNAYVSTGVFYLWIRPLQEPFDLGLDEKGLARVVFNVTGHRRPAL